MVRVWGWQNEMHKMNFILIVRNFTSMDLAEAKACLDRVLAGEAVEFYLSDAERDDEFVEQLKSFNVGVNVESVKI